MPDSVFEAALARATEHLAAGQPEAAHAVMAGHAQRPSGKEQVLGLLSLWRQTPGYSGLVEAVMGLVAGHGTDPQVVTLACDTLIREAERLAPDEPPPADGAAHAALTVVQRCLDGLDQADRENTETLAYLQVCLGNALRLAHLYDRALPALKSALSKRPDHGPWWFNLGLLHKQRGDFAAGLSANKRARELLGEQKALLWNLAICATAIGEGQAAVEAFAALGLSAYVATSGMPQVDYMPPVQVRVATVGPGHMGPSRVPDRAVSFELLWVSPLSPCHGVVQTPTYRQGSVDYGDVVLWDAVPVGMAELEGKPCPRFPLLSVLRPGDEHRFRFIALQRRPGAIAALEGPRSDGLGHVFVHRERVQTGRGLGQDTSLASPAMESYPSGSTSEDERLVYGKVVLPADADLAGFRDAFMAEAALAEVELVIPELLERLGDTAAAGKAHTMWRGLERTIEKAAERRQGGA